MLIIEACRVAVRGSGALEPAGLSEGLDWVLFVRLARFHRVQGLVWNALAPHRAALPVEVADTLAADAAQIAAANLRAAGECAGLRDDFERSEIPVLFVKGLTLAALAYRQPLLKMGWDIDILVADSDVPSAAAELARRGYRRAIPGPGVDLMRWHSRQKESLWSRAEDNLHVELHSRLADSGELIPTITVDSPRREIEVVHGISLPTLGEDELFAYLCVHGAWALWFRLKWITDLAALLHHYRPAEIERLYQRSQALGAERCAGQALLLAHRLYASLDGTGLAALLAADRTTRRLAGAAWTQLAAGPREPTSGMFGTVAIHLRELELKPGLGFKVRELIRQARDVLASTLRRGR